MKKIAGYFFQKPLVLEEKNLSKSIFQRTLCMMGTNLFWNQIKRFYLK